MLCIKDIFKACVCSFCENIYEYDSIDEGNFIAYFRMFCKAENLQGCLKITTSDVSYDIENINNVCNSLLISHFKEFDTYEIEEHCLAAFNKTINKDKTINVEAFVDNLAREFNKLKVL